MRSSDPHPDAAAVARWLDGETPPQRAAELAAHVADCATCRAEVAGWRALATAAGEPLPALPPAFVTRTCARAVASAPLQAPLWWRGVSPAWRLGLAALLLASAAAGWRLGAVVPPPAEPEDALAAALEIPELAAIEQASPRDAGRQP